MTNSAWGGRFQQALDQVAARISASVDTDQRLAPQDIEASIAHVRMLGTTGVLCEDDVQRIVVGLDAIAAKIASGDWHWDPSKEDVHLNIEAALVERIGETGGRLHTARSRNDQVATDMRLWTRSACAAAMQRINRLQGVLWWRANDCIDVLLPGYTHLQRAQPVRLAHHLLAWSEMLERDYARLHDAQQRLNECPLGSGALATTTFPIDRHHTAEALGFARPMRNSLDAVADRDFAVEAVAALSLCAVHLSRIAEELVLWNTQEFGFIEMSDAFATGSSMMPQKKNPDLAELVRGKSGRVVGDLVNLLVLLKGLPLSYNRDMQEDKRPLFDAFDTVSDCLEVTAGMLATVEFRADRMREALRQGFVDATELADYLSERGLPFRQAHHVVGRLVALAASQGKTLDALSLEELQRESPLLDAAAFAVLQPERAVERRNVVGGPAKAQVTQALAELQQRLESRGLDLNQLAQQVKVDQV